MRLPEFFVKLSPVGETLAAAGAGEEALRAAVAEQNARLHVSSADGEGLSLWEADCGLPEGTGEAPETRRARVLAALSGGRTLTAERLRELCAALTGADRGEVLEDFAAWAVTVRPVWEGQPPGDGSPLLAALRREMPAHLAWSVEAVGEAAGAGTVFFGLHGGTLAELWA